ncbi:PqiC family protein [Aestuariibacter halophilus]|uniref:PqiC family protein n=1 Tax=Fluctibacter halophilus TaxID=226011 RepID=A0ABS8G7N0_9ALTE|nr:ABC-type transport auxiliary lipoprotein family protein [Aestuariibacter halophilus]MCC2616086.1 PqiC family protein [Aestuariibacter halophilus]
MMLRRLVMLCLVLLLSGCMSQPSAPMRYFVLDEALPHAEYARTQEHHRLVLQPLRLANYLSQPNLPMRLSSHEVYYSPNHSWAEPLSKGFAKALLHDLNAAMSSPWVALSYRDPAADNDTVQLLVELDHFVATEDGNCIVDGVFWLQSAQGDVLLKRGFHYQDELAQGGFDNAITQLRQSVTRLARDITLALDQQTGNNDGH